jgi:hypothetical protein
LEDLINGLAELLRGNGGDGRKRGGGGGVCRGGECVGCAAKEKQRGQKCETETPKDVPGGTPATAGEDARAPRNREIAVEIKKRKPAVFPKAPSIPLQKIDKTSKSGRILHVNECECAASAPRRG